MPYLRGYRKIANSAGTIGEFVKWLVFHEFFYFSNPVGEVFKVEPDASGQM